MPKVKKISVHIGSVEDYLEMMNGFFGLTDTEKQVLAQFIKEKLSSSNGFSAPHLFHHTVKRRISKRMGRKNHYWLNGYVMSLKKKNALISKEGEGEYEINRALIPDGEQRVEININWKKDK